MEVICPRCNTDADIDTADDGNLTCLKCGCIVEETDRLRAEIDLVTSESGTRACGSIVSATSTGTSIATSLPRGVFKRPTSYLSHGTSSSVQKSIDKIAQMIGVDKPTVDQMHYLYDRVIHKEKYCRNPDLLAASIVYIVLRQSGKPYTMLDVSGALHINVFAIGRVVTRVLATNFELIKLNAIEPSLFVEKACMEMSDWPEQKKKTIKTLAARIINALKNFWLITGRRHDAIAAAAIFIAGEALAITIDMGKLCKALNVTETTIKTRSKEMKSSLLDQSKGIIPWIKEVDVKVIHKQIPKILDTLERLSTVFTKKKESSESPQSNLDNSESLATLPTNSTPSLEARSVSSTSSLPIVHSSSSVVSLPIPSSSSSAATSSSSSSTSSKNGVKKELEPIANPLALPPSYKVSLIARKRRIQKLTHAKLRLLTSYQKCPEMFSALPQLKALLESPSFTSVLPSFNPPTPPSPLTPPSPGGSPPATTFDGYPIAPDFKPPRLFTSSSTLSSPSIPPPPFSASLPPTLSLPSIVPPEHPATIRRSQTKRAIKKEKEREKETKETKENIFISLMPNLDQEDLLIEKLLLNGADEQSIINGYYETELSRTNTAPHHNLNSEKVGELDIPENEMHKFIRNEAEINILSQLPVPEPEVAKKKTTTKRKQRGTGEDGEGGKRRRGAPKKRAATTTKTVRVNAEGQLVESSDSKSSSEGDESDQEVHEISKLPASSL